MSEATSTVHKISQEAGQILGEVAELLEAEGREDLPLARRVRRSHERLVGNVRERVAEGQGRAPGAAGTQAGTGQPAVDELDELDEICRAQRAALERIASGVQPAQGDRGPTMITVREARAIAQNALQLSTGKTDHPAQSDSSPARYAEREAERLRASVHSGDLHGAKQQARMILEHNEVPNESDPATSLLRTFAQTLSGMLEGKIGVDVRHTATSSLVRNEQEARQAAERRAEQMERESADLRRALAWYADEANYRATPDGPDRGHPDERYQEILQLAVEHDQGRRAHQALDNSEAGRQVARRLEAAETFIELLRANLATHQQEISQELSQ